MHDEDNFDSSMDDARFGDARTNASLFISLELTCCIRRKTCCVSVLDYPGIIVELQNSFLNKLHCLDPKHYAVLYPSFKAFPNS
jgi:hypothetical protein